MRRLCLFTVLLLIILISATHPAPKPNVLLISVDTLRSDYLGLYGSKEKTPAFDALGARSVVFENAISQVPLTLPSHATIFTGHFPQDHGIKNNEVFVLSKKFTTMAEHFQKYGYRTGAAVGSFALDSEFGLDQGFEWYEDKIKPSSSGERYSERRAETVWNIAREWLEKQNTSPWFFFLHFYDPHTAYAPPKPFSQDYRGEIQYTDSILKQVTGFLQNNNLYNTTIVVLLSDHGEALGEHGEASHGVFLYDSVLKVPLMISAPGLKPDRIKSQVRLADVAPTLFELAGLPGLKLESSLTGISLIPLIQGKSMQLPAYSESYYTHLLMGWAPLHSIRTSNFKWIDAPKGELYNLATDPLEMKNLYSAGSVPVEIRREMEKYLSRRNEFASVEQADSELKERLASLGYVTGSSTVVQGGSNLDPKDGIVVWTKIETAVTMAQLNRMPEAETGLRNALKMQPDNVIAKKFLANVLARQNKTQDAILMLEDAMKSPLHRNETRIELAKLYYGAGRYKDLLNLLKAETPLQSSDAVALKLIGLSSAHINDYRTAAAYLKRALELYPLDPDSLSTYARILSYLKKDQEALHKYTELEALRSLTEPEAIQIAAIYLTMGNPASAEIYFKKAVAINPESTKSWEGLAIIYASRKDWSSAFTAFLNAGNCKGAAQILNTNYALPKDLLDSYEAKCKE